LSENETKYWGKPSFYRVRCCTTSVDNTSLQTIKTLYSGITVSINHSLKSKLD